MAVVIFNKVKEALVAKFGKTTEAGIGFSVGISGEVISAEYIKDDKKKQKTTKNGAKVFKLAVKVSREIEKKDGTVIKFGEVVYVDGFEKAAVSNEKYSFPAIKLSQFKPKTKTVNGKEVITEAKFINIFAQEGMAGAGFPSFRVMTYIAKKGKKKGQVTSAIQLRGANLKAVTKKDGVLVYQGFNKEEKFKVDERIKCRVKGFFEPIKSTENFLANNVDEKNKTLKIKFYYEQSQKKQDSNEYYEVTPMTLLFNYSDLESDVTGPYGLIKAVKEEFKNRIICVYGAIEQRALFAKEEVKKVRRGFGKKGGTSLGYEAVMIVESELQNEGMDDQFVQFSVSETGFTGELVVKRADPELKVAKTEMEKTVEEESEEDVNEDIEINDDDLDLDEEIEPKEETVAEEPIEEEEKVEDTKAEDSDIEDLETAAEDSDEEEDLGEMPEIDLEDFDDFEDIPKK